MKKLLLGIFLIISAQELKAEEPVDIYKEIHNFAEEVIHDSEIDLKVRQKALKARVQTISSLMQDEKEFETEVQTLKSSLAETLELFELKRALRAELSSEPSPEELMKTFFELKALGKI